MNSGLAKGPRDSVSWNAIDIFLFANGQQYSPPRKYHLEASELEFWEGTLNHLARAHYGSRYSMIEIYTTDGRKIVSPMELSNGGTYVAVIPPDTFVDTGYEKYLLKASRSWERRHRLQSRTMEVSKPDAVTKPVNEEVQENLSEMYEDTKHDVDTKPEKILSGKLITGHAFDNKKRSLRSPKDHITKRNLHSSYLKNNSIPKNNATKKVTKTATAKTKNGKITASKDFGKNIVAIKTKKVPPDPEFEYDLEAKESYKTIILDKPPQIEIPSIANSLYTNSVKDLTLVHVLTEPNESHSNNDEECRNIAKQIVENALYKERVSYGKDAKRPSRKLSENRFDKYLTLINKGDIMSLKLNIEVKNAEGITTMSKENDEKVINSIPYKTYMERSSQTNMNINISSISLHAHHANESRKGSLESIISDIYYQPHYGRPKVIILKCPCCDHQCIIDEMSTLPTDTKEYQNKNIVIVMPVNTSDGAETQNNFKFNKPSENQSDKEEKQGLSSSELRTPPTEAQSNELMKNLVNDKYENEQMELLKNNSHKQLVPLKTGSQMTHSSYVKFGDTKKITKTPSLESNKSDACILTDWCDVILEAKVEDDGNYSFYLPSLQTLRYYNL